MSILGTCWTCGETGPIELFLADAQARTALAAALRLPAELADLLIPYLALHAPVGEPGRARRRLAPGKLTRLLEELAALISSGQVERNRDTRAAPQSAWADALRAVLAMRDAGTLVVPLTGHGLLCEIVYRQAVSGRAAAAGAAARPLHPSHLPAAAPGRDPDPAPTPPPPAAPRVPRPAPVGIGQLLQRLRHAPITSEDPPHE